jgi:hypothetical protein
MEAEAIKRFRNREAIAVEVEVLESVVAEFFKVVVEFFGAVAEALEAGVVVATTVQAVVNKPILP